MLHALPNTVKSRAALSRRGSFEASPSPERKKPRLERYVSDHISGSDSNSSPHSERMNYEAPLSGEEALWLDDIPLLDDLFPGINPARPSPPSPPSPLAPPATPVTATAPPHAPPHASASALVFTPATPSSVPTSPAEPPLVRPPAAPGGRTSGNGTFLQQRPADNDGYVANIVKSLEDHRIVFPFAVRREMLRMMLDCFHNAVLTYPAHGRPELRELVLTFVREGSTVSPEDTGERHGFTHEYLRSPLLSEAANHAGGSIHDDRDWQIFYRDGEAHLNSSLTNNSQKYSVIEALHYLGLEKRIRRCAAVPESDEAFAISRVLRAAIPLLKRPSLASFRRMNLILDALKHFTLSRHPLSKGLTASLHDAAGDMLSSKAVCNDVAMHYIRAILRELRGGRMLLPAVQGAPLARRVNDIVNAKNVTFQNKCGLVGAMLQARASPLLANVQPELKNTVERFIMNLPYSAVAENVRVQLYDEVTKAARDHFFDFDSQTVEQLLSVFLTKPSQAARRKPANTVE